MATAQALKIRKDEILPLAALYAHWDGAFSAKELAEMTGFGEKKTGELLLKFEERNLVTRFKRDSSDTLFAISEQGYDNIRSILKEAFRD